MCWCCGQAPSCEGGTGWRGLTQSSYKDAGGLLLSWSVCAACPDVFTSPRGPPGAGGLSSREAWGARPLASGVLGAVQSKVKRIVALGPVSGSWRQETVVLGVGRFLAWLRRASLTPDHHSRRAACAGCPAPPGAQPPRFWRGRVCEGGRAPVGLACCPRTLTVSGPPGPLASRDLTRAGCFWSQKVSEAAGGTGLGLRVLLGAAWRDPRGWAAPDCSPTRLRPLVSGQESDYEDTWAVVPPLIHSGSLQSLATSCS